MRDPERIFEPKRDETAGLALFDAQRLASPDASDEPRPVPRVAMPGASTLARAIAHEDATRSLAGRRGKILAALAAYGPRNRFQLHELTGLTENSVNSACHALLESGHVRTLPALDASDRSVLALTPAPESA